METRFPEEPGYAGQFVVGVRRAGAVERTGTAILKRTYDIDPATGRLTPSAEALPVFMRDQPDNLLLNSDFESLLTDDGEPIDWHPEGVTISRVSDPAAPSNHVLEISGTARGRVVQTVAFDEPLGGRTFSFSFRAGSVGTSARIDSVQLEADDVVLCRIDADLVSLLARWATTGTWPSGLEATRMRVVLRMATRAADRVLYDHVQVEERAYDTVWSPFGTPRAENDLAPFKPQGDLVVLGLTSEAGPLRVRVDGEVWLSRTLGSVEPREKAAFGWQPRETGPRKAEAAFPENDDAYPLPEALPAGFDNHFYNGHLRDAVSGSLPYLPADAQVRLERGGELVYTFTLRGDAPAATYHFHAGTGPDEEGSWQAEPVSMPLDTLVVEPEADRCYAVWRGVWPFDHHPHGAYRRLAVVSDP
jgi:hypothetical protein